jgi:hypothetical protein
MSCACCYRDVKIVGRGLCRACYQRWHKKGSTDYAPKRQRQFCQIDDCGKPVVSNGLCDMHRQRLRKHGDVHETSLYGVKTKHPLYNAWAGIRRYRSQHPHVPEWADFLVFVQDVGEKPSAKHKIFSANEEMPIGPTNFVWKEAITQIVPGEDRKTSEARRQRVYRKLRPEAYTGYDLKRHYGMTAAEYAARHEDQAGICAICKRPETTMTRGRLRRLAVDHCHSGGHVRALLCTGCNTGLGGFNDDPAILRSAIVYLEKHALPKTVE